MCGRLKVNNCWYCIAGTALPVLYCRYCITGTVLPALHYRYCTAGTALQVLYCRHCITGTVLPVLHYWYCIAGTALPVLYCQYALPVLYCQYCITGTVSPVLHYRYCTAGTVLLNLINRSATCTTVVFSRHDNNAMWQQAITWWNPAAQTHPVLDSSSFVPVLMLPCRIFLHSASSVLAVHISCRIIAPFVFRKPLLINKIYRTYVCYMKIKLL
jgi:hypothetical protein